MNQNPSSLSADLTTRNDLNGNANSRVLRRSSSSEVQAIAVQEPDGNRPPEKGGVLGKEAEVEVGGGHDGGRGSSSGSSGEHAGQAPQNLFMKVRKLAITFGKFIGPGFMVRLQDSPQLVMGAMLMIFPDLCGLHRPW